MSNNTNDDIKKVKSDVEDIKKILTEKDKCEADLCDVKEEIKKVAQETKKRGPYKKKEKELEDEVKELKSEVKKERSKRGPYKKKEKELEKKLEDEKKSRGSYNKSKKEAQEEKKSRTDFEKIVKDNMAKSSQRDKDQREKESTAQDKTRESISKLLDDRDKRLSKEGYNKYDLMNEQGTLINTLLYQQQEFADSADKRAADNEREQLEINRLTNINEAEQEKLEQVQVELKFKENVFKEELKELQEQGNIEELKALQDNKEEQFAEITSKLNAIKKSSRVSEDNLLEMQKRQKTEAKERQKAELKDKFNKKTTDFHKYQDVNLKDVIKEKSDKQKNNEGLGKLLGDSGSSLATSAKESIQKSLGAGVHKSQANKFLAGRDEKDLSQGELKKLEVLKQKDEIDKKNVEKKNSGWKNTLITGGLGGVKDKASKGMASGLAGMFGESKLGKKVKDTEFGRIVKGFEKGKESELTDKQDENKLDEDLKRLELEEEMLDATAKGGENLKEELEGLEEKIKENAKEAEDERIQNERVYWEEQLNSSSGRERVLIESRLNQFEEETTQLLEGRKGDLSDKEKADKDLKDATSEIEYSKEANKVEIQKSQDRMNELLDNNEDGMSDYDQEEFDSLNDKIDGLRKDISERDSGAFGANLKKFSIGGPTGDGDDDEVAGLVHKNEYVLSSVMLDRLKDLEPANETDKMSEVIEKLDRQYRETNQNEDLIKKSIDESNQTQKQIEKALYDMTHQQDTSIDTKGKEGLAGAAIGGTDTVGVSELIQDTAEDGDDLDLDMSKGFFKKHAGKLAKFGAYAVAAAAVAGSAYYIGNELVDNYDAYQQADNDYDRDAAVAKTSGGLAGAAAGGLAGAKAGGALGLLLGSAVPLLGNVVGGLAGAVTGGAAGAALGYYLGDKAGAWVQEKFAGPLDRIPDEQKKNPFVMDNHLRYSVIPEMKNALAMESDPEKKKDIQDGIDEYEELLPDILSPDSIEAWMEDEIDSAGGDDWDQVVKRDYLTDLMGGFIGNEQHYNAGLAVIQDPDGEFAELTGFSKVTDTVGDFLFGSPSKEEQKTQLAQAKAITAYNKKNKTNFKAGDESSTNLDTMEEMGIINQVGMGKSDIKDWEKVEGLPKSMVDVLIEDNDWSDKDMKRLKEISASMKSEVEKQELENQKVSVSTGTGSNSSPETLVGATSAKTKKLAQTGTDSKGKALSREINKANYIPTKETGKGDTIVINSSGSKEAPSSMDLNAFNNNKNDSVKMMAVNG